MKKKLFLNFFDCNLNKQKKYSNNSQHSHVDMKEDFLIIKHRRSISNACLITFYIQIRYISIKKM